MKHLNSCYNVSIPLTDLLLPERRNELAMCPINIINSNLAENRFVGHRISLILGKKKKKKCVILCFS